MDVLQPNSNSEKNKNQKPKWNKNPPPLCESVLTDSPLIWAKRALVFTMLFSGHNTTGNKEHKFTLKTEGRHGYFKIY